MNPPTPTSPSTQIRLLTIKRFRGIEKLEWRPSEGTNIILGGGDVGKSSILDAIAIVLSPITPTIVPDTDYFQRDVDKEFSIEIVVSLSDDSGINYLRKPASPWEWDGENARLPTIDEKQKTGLPVYRLRVTGTADLELAYEIVQPNESTDHLSVSLRRSIGLVRLAGDDRNDRDLRLVRGSALDRLLKDKNLRSKLAHRLKEAEIGSDLTEESKAVISELDAFFTKRKLPDKLTLSMLGSPGYSVAALIGLAADKNGEQLPLTSWGSGTRRIAALSIAEYQQSESPVTVVDEVERGLEPYRQRVLIKRLQSSKFQSFITTHSPFIIKHASEASIWYLDHKGSIGLLPGEKIAPQRISDPETFLSRFVVVGEGITECGFIKVLLEAALSSTLLDHGIHLCDAKGDTKALPLLEALTNGGLSFAGFADRSTQFPEKWKLLQNSMGQLLFLWPSGCIEENIIKIVPDKDDQLMHFISHVDPHITNRRLQSLAERLNCEDKSFPVLRERAGSNFHQYMIDAAVGNWQTTFPEDDKKKFTKRHPQFWFKNLQGGHELARKMFALNIWQHHKDRLLKFINAVLVAVGVPEVKDIQL